MRHDRLSGQRLAVLRRHGHDGAVNTSLDNDAGHGLVWCFQCAREYDEDVDLCLECAVPTTAERPTDVSAVGDDGDDQLAYELHEWTGQGRSTLDGMLARSGVPHAWQGATLIVREADEQMVDDAIAQTEVVAMPTLDLTQPTMVYELDGLEDIQHARLLRRLGDAGLSHAFDAEGDVHVYEADEEAIDDIFEGLDEADLSEREFGPGVSQDPLSVISDMFVAVGRLRKRPGDGKTVVSVVETAALIQQMRLPYGLGVEVWSEVVDESAGLSDALTDRSGVADDELQERTELLHAKLRRLV